MEQYSAFDQTTHQLAVRLLGGLSLVVDGAEIGAPASGRARSLLELLALRHPQPVPREVVIDVLWPEMDEARGRNNLNVTVFAARRALGRIPSGGIVFDRARGLYRFDPQVAITVDVAEFRRAVAAGRRLEIAGDVDGALRIYAVADALYAGDLLSDQPYVEWVAPERAGLKEMWLECLDRLGGLFEQRDRWTEAEWAAERAALADPLDERPVGRRVRLMAAHGQAERAVRVFRCFEDRLLTELGMPASQQLVQFVGTLVTMSRAVSV